MPVVIDSFGWSHSPLHGTRLHFATRRRRRSARCNSATPPPGHSTPTPANRPIILASATPQPPRGHFQPAPDHAFICLLAPPLSGLRPVRWSGPRAPAPWRAAGVCRVPWTLRRAWRLQASADNGAEPCLLLARVSLSMDHYQTAEPAALLGTQTGRSLLAGKLSLLSVVLVGPELTQGPGHVTGHAGLTCPPDRCSPPYRSRPGSCRAGR
jgi:hypothetical protein